MNQGVKVYAVQSAASNKNPLAGCCEEGNELFFLVQNKTVMKLLCRFEGRKCIDDVRECRLLIGSSR
jgi:hypothetical protein